MATIQDFDIPGRPSYPYKDRKKEPTVETPHPDYKEMAEHWDLILDLKGGTLEMREEGVKWLPIEPKESWSAYYNRLNRTVLYGAYNRTVQALSGLPFRRAALIKNAPPDLEYLKEDCDSDGSDITSFSQRLLTDLLDFGKAHILVDMPIVTSGTTLKDMEDNKIRPYLTHICPTSLISWENVKFELVSGGMKKEKQ